MANTPTVAVVGLGLLGTSLCMALRGKGYRRLAWTRRAELRKRAVAENVADAAPDSLPALLGEADVTIFALPLDATAEFLERYASCWRPGSVVSDVGSLKAHVTALGQKLLAPRHVAFIGGHPMAGTEKSGYDAAFPTLYENADVFLTPGADTSPEAMERLKRLWETLHCHPRFIAPEHHDQLVARTSHVLHILASALTRSILGTAGDPAGTLERFSGCATGFKDTTRIASSNPAMWREIVQQNRSAILTAMAEFEEEYALLKKSVQEGDFDRFESLFAEGKALRDRWLEYKKSGK